MRNINILVLVILFSVQSWAQQDFSKTVITETLIKENFYLLQGAGGNILICIGADEVLMIDSQFAPLSERIAQKITELSQAKPIKYLLNTHFHGDHTGGNENFNAEETTLVAHANVKTRLSKDQFYKAFDRTVKAKAMSYWPELGYQTEMNLNFSGHNLILTHLPNAHTDGDSGVFFTEDNVVHMGDTFFKDRFPYIDLASGGSINGLIEAVKSCLIFVDEKTIIVPGHGSLANKADLEKYLEMLQTMKRKVQYAISEGMTYEEIQGLNLTSGYESWGGGFINAEKIVDTIWTDLSRK